MLVCEWIQRATPVTPFHWAALREGRGDQVVAAARGVTLVAPRKVNGVVVNEVAGAELVGVEPVPPCLATEQRSDPSRYPWTDRWRLVPIRLRVISSKARARAEACPAK